MGDPTTEEGRALLRERSPLNFADKISRPLLIGQGANDPRVNVLESDQIVAAMEAKHIPLTYVVFPHEGYGLARPVNKIVFNAVAENFLDPLPRRARGTDRRCAAAVDGAGDAGEGICAGVEGVVGTIAKK